MRPGPCGPWDEPTSLVFKGTRWTKTGPEISFHTAALEQAVFAAEPSLFPMGSGTSYSLCPLAWETELALWA